MVLLIGTGFVGMGRYPSQGRPLYGFRHANVLPGPYFYHLEKEKASWFGGTALPFRRVHANCDVFPSDEEGSGIQGVSQTRKRRGDWTQKDSFMFPELLKGGDEERKTGLLHVGQRPDQRYVTEAPTLPYIGEHCSHG